ncbi:RluA family pseudouridine synthase [Sediminispirochaeta smaragdinae]|jgi:23S rRNA pseudouridine1911/1915/1917 synthase|uniref:Pseudouridine synthase n=1 Tax=Sediminispirochaeta smaragdinae (strain DSM 11293 / JCM 15392 / SEBR 4228) TaxID=573413 RepID=E1R9B8_SEDSS|nr:RNA pseudouridine synthase [Sediminispirochaeta smaragdinae]ADK83087.1 pseudouridine synthase [Sediminispirochaeta smaragdinae DSM 11293]
MPEVLYEDNHLIVVNKRCGDIVQGDKSGDPTLADEVKEYLREKYNKPGNVFLGIPHRLDRPTSGVVLYARTEKALRRLSLSFREQHVEKIYWAVVDKMPPAESGTLVHYLRRDRKKNKSFASDTPTADSQEAKMRYRLVGATNRYYLLEIELLTGRHHQIRAQLAAVGCRIRGDLKYGYPRSNRDGGIHLHARKVSLDHPVGERNRITITADPPSGDPLWAEFLRLEEG